MELFRALPKEAHTNVMPEFDFSFGMDTPLYITGRSHKNAMISRARVGSEMNPKTAPSHAYQASFTKRYIVMELHRPCERIILLIL
jgi:hypothetical protein